MGNRARYAGLESRFSVLLTDVALLFVLFLPVTQIVKGAWIMDATDHRWTHGLLITDPLCVPFLLVIFLYFILFEGLAGATLGKCVLGLRSRERPGWFESGNV